MVWALCLSHVLLGSGVKLCEGIGLSPKSVHYSNRLCQLCSHIRPHRLSCPEEHLYCSKWCHLKHTDVILVSGLKMENILKEVKQSVGNLKVLVVL